MPSFKMISRNASDLFRQELESGTPDLLISQLQPSAPVSRILSRKVSCIPLWSYRVRGLRSRRYPRFTTYADSAPKHGFPVPRLREARTSISYEPPRGVALDPR